MNLKNIYKPSPEFKTETKNLFLAKFGEKFGSYQRTNFAFKYFIRGIGVGVSFAFILSVTAIYADGRNVGPENILYGFKRSQEAVSITFSSDEEKPEAHVRLAERRLNEIKGVQNKDPKSPLIVSLKNDLAREIKSSVKTVKSKKESKLVGEGRVLPGVDKSLPTGVGTETSEVNELGVDMPPARSSQNLQATNVRAIDKKSSRLCRSWDQIIGDDGELIFEVVNKDRELRAWFEENCSSSLRESSGEESHIGTPQKDSEKSPGSDD
ncbi:MAG: hypothetical protein G01um101420_237 [Parcubacteria group bacterium Gr01-1014_20]|nr:MAG: hypothetical protein G01um101420_237 [Parcubacteria group bacterium Gr01-1014_20]